MTMKKLMILSLLCSHLSIIGMNQQDTNNSKALTTNFNTQLSSLITITPETVDQYIQILAVELDTTKHYKLVYKGTDTEGNRETFKIHKATVPNMLLKIKKICQNGTVEITHWTGN